MDSQAPVSELRNLGKTSSMWLSEVGIRTIGDLRQVGAVTAYRIVRDSRGKTQHGRTPASRPSLNLLWALAAGLQDIDWRELSDEQKQSLRAELDT